MHISVCAISNDSGIYLNKIDASHINPRFVIPIMRLLVL